MKIERDKLYRNRAGDKMRVICTDLPGEYPVAAVTSGGNLYVYTSVGVCLETGLSRDDLVSEYKEPQEYWLNVYGNGAKSAEAFLTEQDANEFALEGRIGCIKVREVV
jgi:hypothetical protein